MLPDVIAYTVTATFPDEATAAEYIAWLRGGHLEHVLEAGARSAAVVRVSEPADPITVETRYTFASRGELDRYVRERAPALRAQGMARFPPERGVRFQRRVGEFAGAVLERSHDETTLERPRS
jgi:hypothetical protein